MKLIKRRALLAYAISSACLPIWAYGAEPQSWPVRPVKLIVPLGPGSAVDISARLFAERLSMIWDKPVIVENRPGGDGMVGTLSFIGARDDHVLMFSPSAAFLAHPYLHEKLPYNPRDIVPIARVCETIIAIAVPSALNVNSMGELVGLAKREPGKLSYAATTGMLDFVITAFLKTEALDVARVPYRDSVQAVNDLAESRIQIMAAAIAILRPQVENGRIKMIALTNSKRSELAINIPTVAESGFSSLYFDGLQGIFGPPIMPLSLRERIAADIRNAAEAPVIRNRLSLTGQTLNPGSAVEMEAAMEEQRSRALVVAKILNLKASQ
jgi:tripartite-type tricarboxylate transporter receptor subunit TctC